jgi:hypothetical protein
VTVPVLGEETAMSATDTTMRHGRAAAIRCAVLAGLASAVLLPATMASASGPKSSTSTSSIRLLSADPALGATVYFGNAYPNGTKNPADEVNCYQNGTVVWGEILSISQAQQYGFLLGGNSSPWLTNGGSATCSAQLISVDFKPSGETITVLADDPFTAAP